MHVHGKYIQHPHLRVSELTVYLRLFVRLTKLCVRQLYVYRGNRPTNKHTATDPQTGPITIHCAAS